MSNCYSANHIAEDHIHTDITCNIKEPEELISRTHGEGRKTPFNKT